MNTRQAVGYRDAATREADLVGDSTVTIKRDDDPELARGQLPEGTVRSSKFLGYDVLGPRDEVIASVEDVVFDLETPHSCKDSITAPGQKRVARL